MKLKKILLTSIVTVLGLAIIGGAGIFAYYQNKTLSQTNQITIGQKVDTVTLGSAENPATELYPGDSVTVEYLVTIENHEGDVTVSAVVDQPADFTVEVKDKANLEGGVITTVTNGMTIAVVVTMNESVETVPEYDTITLTVTLTEAGAQA